MKRKARTSRAERTVAGYSRQAYSLPPDVAEGIRRIAYWERLTLSEVVARAVRDFREKLEKQRGEPYAPVGSARLGQPER